MGLSASWGAISKTPKANLSQPAVIIFKEGSLPFRASGRRRAISVVFLRRPAERILGDGAEINYREIMSQQHDRGLAVIAVFKVSKALLLSVLGVGMLRLLHKDVQEVVESWINLLRFDPDNRFVAALLAKAGLVDDKKLAELSVLTLVYAALFMTEGIGLFLGKRWAEWLSVVATASFLPLEIYEIIQHFSSVRVALFVSNLVIVGYLIFLLRKHPSTA